MSSFQFLSAGAFWWLLILPVIIILYFLKLKREQQKFSSTMLWRKTIEDMRVNSPFQRLKNNLLLFLQCLLLVLLIFALSRPFLSQEWTPGKHIVLLIDNSASMQAKDGPEGKTRLAIAQNMAEAIIADLNEDDQAMIVSLADPVVVLSPFTRSKNNLRQAIGQIPPSHSKIQLSEGIIIADNLTKNRPNSKIVVFTDGAISGLDRLLQNYYTSHAAASPVVPDFVIIGSQSDNVAILAFEIDQHAQGFARIQNLGEHEISGLLQLRLNDELLSQANRLLELKPGDVQNIVWQNLPIQEGKAELHFIVTKGEDYLEQDNHAYCYVAPIAPPKIAVISSNVYLRKMMQALSLEHEILNLEDFFKLAPQRHYDLAIIEGISPTIPLPPGNYLFFHAVPSAVPNLEWQQYIQSKEGENLKIIDQNDVHPIMRFVDMRRISLTKAMNVKWPTSTTILLEIENHAIITTFQDESHRYVVVAFDLWQSNWPLQISYPIFVQNTIRWFQDQNASSWNQLVSKPLYMRFRPPYPIVNIISPSEKNSQIALSSHGLGSFANTLETGFYKMEAKAGDQLQTSWFAVNLFSAEESTIMPAKNIQLGKRDVAQTKPLLFNREIWKYLILIALMMLMIEWQWYHRRSFSWGFLWPKKTIQTETVWRR